MLTSRRRLRTGSGRSRTPPSTRRTRSSRVGLRSSLCSAHDSLDDMLPRPPRTARNGAPAAETFCAGLAVVSMRNASRTRWPYSESLVDRRGRTSSSHPRVLGSRRPPGSSCQGAIWLPKVRRHGWVPTVALAIGVAGRVCACGFVGQPTLARDGRSRQCGSRLLCSWPLRQARSSSGWTASSREGPAVTVLVGSRL